MSNTGFKFKDVLLQVLDFALVGAVDLPRNKPQIARFIALVDIDTVKFQMRLVPSVKRNNVAKERSFVSAPRRM
jgi:hypothetical protein